MFSKECDKYYSKGISVIPSKGKKVIVPSFGQYSFRVPKSNEINYFKKRFNKYNMGLMMGPVNRLMCIDIDTDKKDVIDTIKKILPKTPSAKFGSKGLTMFYRTVRKTNEMFISKEHGCMLEFLCTSRYTIIPPSIHPKLKKPYTWVGKPILDCLDEIPECTQEQLNEIDSYMRTKYKCLDILEIRNGVTN